MNILVCLRQILDPEIPTRDFRIAASGKEAERGGASLVTNIFCENALETALQFRDKHGGKITALAFGPASAEDSLRKALALKADDAVHVLNDGASNPDPLTVAMVLAAAAKKLGTFDLILVGRESGDWGMGQTGALLAEEMGLGFLAFVDHFEPAVGGLKIRRQTEVGREVYEAKTPIVLSITNDDHNVPRIPKTKDVMLSFKKPLTRWTLADLPIDVSLARAGNGYVEVASLSLPEKKADCHFIAGDSLDARIEDFAKRIHEIVGSL